MIPAQIDGRRPRPGMTRSSLGYATLTHIPAKGGTLKDLAKRISDSGLTVEDAIAFNAWLDDDDTRRAASMEQLKRDMDKVAQIGGKSASQRLQATMEKASISTMRPNTIPLRWSSEYRWVCSLYWSCGASRRFWARYQNGVSVTIETGRPDASMLLDIFHLYKSGIAFPAPSANQWGSAARDPHQRLSRCGRSFQAERFQSCLPR